MKTHPRLSPTIQVVNNPRDPEQLVVHRVRARDRLVAHLRASSLDTQLAAGRSPESTQLLATRAEQLVSVTMRRELARNFHHVLDLVDQAPAPRSPRVLASRESVKEVEVDLRQMLTKLATPLPTSARGVAMVRLLLTDGTGPLYDRHCSTTLRDAVQDAAAQLDMACSATASPGQRSVTLEQR
jgi:hypothetical protein